MKGKPSSHVRAVGLRGRGRRRQGDALPGCCEAMLRAPWTARSPAPGPAIHMRSTVTPPSIQTPRLTRQFYALLKVSSLARRSSIMGFAISLTPGIARTFLNNSSMEGRGCAMSATNAVFPSTGSLPARSRSLSNSVPSFSNCGSAALADAASVTPCKVVFSPSSAFCIDDFRSTPSTDRLPAS